MKILLVIAPPPKTAPFSTSEKRPPLGVGYLISVLRQAGHTVLFEDLYLRYEPIFESPDYLLRNKIDAVGISTSSICYAQALEIMQALQRYRERGIWSGQIWVGGPHTSFGTPSIPEYVDHIVIGEGERATLDLADGKKMERVIRAPLIEDLDTLPQLPWADFITRPYDWTLEGTASPVYTFNTSRGCPFSCTFCSVRGIWGKTYRFMSAERVLDDVEMMIKYYGLRSAYFREDHFTLNQKRTIAFCEGVLERNLSIEWSCETRADSIDDPHVIELMARSGCRRIYVGVESGSPKMLKVFRKGETVEQFEKVIALARRHGIKTYASIVVGAPGETSEDVKLTHDFLARTKPDFVGFNVYVGLPGSIISETIERYGLAEYTDPVTSVTYLKGHNIRARKFYGVNTDLLSPVETPGYEYLLLDEAELSADQGDVTTYASLGGAKQSGAAEPATQEALRPAAGDTRLAVLMSVHDGEAHLREAVESILAQTLADFRFVIVDDASTDATPDILRELADKDARIQVLTNEHNLGLSASLNRGLELCDTVYVARMDADDIAYPSRLATQLDYLDSHSEVAVCGTWADIFIDGCEETSLLKAPAGDDEIRATMFLRNPLNHPTVVFRKDAVLRAGGYDATIRHAQDYELWSRLAGDPEVRFANLDYSGLRYRTYPEETRDRYRDSQRSVVMAVSERLLRRAGFPLPDHEVPLLHALVALSKPENTDSMLQLAAFSLRLLDWGRANLARGASTFAQCVEESIEETLGRYHGVAELHEALREQQTALGKYEEGIEFFKQQLANHQEIIAEYQRKEAKAAVIVRTIGKKILRKAPDLVSLWHKIDVKTCVLLKKAAGKIHPAGDRYVEKLEYCLRCHDMGPIRRYADIRARRLKAGVMHVGRRLHLLRPFSPSPLQDGQPLVSVVIPCFNYGRYVEEAIDSVLAQTLKNIEIIVVEGGSTDGVTRSLLESLDKPKTTVLFQDSPTMVGENRNLGIRHSRGRYVCCLDADDLILPTYLEKAAYLLETYGYDVVSTAYATFGETQTTYGVLPVPTLRDMLEGNHIMTCAVFRRDTWARTPSGFVDSGKGADHVAEDWRLWIELAAQGARMRNIVNEPLLLYRTHGNSLSTEHGMRSLSSQCEQICADLAPVLTPEAFKRSARASRDFRYCSVPGGAMGARHCRKSQSDAGVNRKPTLLVCMGLIINGGAERLLSTVVGHLVAQGWRVVVVCTVDDLTENSQPISWFTAHTPEVYQLQRFLSDDEERADFIRYLIASRRVDIVLLAGSVLLYRMLKGLRAACPHLAVVDLLFNTAPEGHIASNRRHRAEIDHIITENSEVESWLHDHGEERSAVSRIFSGISVPHVAVEDAAALRAALGIPADCLVFGFSGRLSPEKNPLALVELASRCRDMERVYFVMTGGGAMADAVARRKEELGLQRLLFKGFVDDPATYLAMYDALLLPSVQDGRPVAVMEAMLLGTPCLASRIGGLPEMVEDGVTGLLAPPGDVGALEQAVRLAAADPAKLKAFGAAAQAFACVHFDPPAMCRNYEDALLRAIAARRHEA